MRGHHARSSGALKACFGEGARAAAALVPAASARHETGDGLCMSCLLDWVCFFLSQGQCTAHDRCSTNRISVTSDTLRLCLTSRPNPPRPCCTAACSTVCATSTCTSKCSESICLPAAVSGTPSRFIFCSNKRLPTIRPQDLSPQKIAGIDRS